MIDFKETKYGQCSRCGELLTADHVCLDIELQRIRNIFSKDLEKINNIFSKDLKETTEIFSKNLENLNYLIHRHLNAIEELQNKTNLSRRECSNILLAVGDDDLEKAECYAKHLKIANEVLKDKKKWILEQVEKELKKG